MGRNLNLNTIGAKKGGGFGPELFVTSNAASDSAGNESNATTGFSQVGLDAGANVFASQGTVKNVGSYSIQGDSNDTPTNLARFYMDLNTELSLVNGVKYSISLDARHIGAGRGWTVALGSSPGAIENPMVVLSNTDITFQTYTLEFTHVASTRYLVSRETSGFNDGGVYLDNVSIKEVL